MTTNMTTTIRTVPLSHLAQVAYECARAHGPAVACTATELAPSGFAGGVFTSLRATAKRRYIGTDAQLAAIPKWTREWYGLVA